MTAALAAPAVPYPQLLTTEQAAQALGLAPKTLRNWASAGQGPAVIRIGGRVRYAPEDLKAYIDACREQPITMTPHTTGAAR